MRAGVIIAAGLLGYAGWLMMRPTEEAATDGGGVFEDVAASVTDAVESVGDFVRKLMRGERNNNPGNIRLSGINWQGEVSGADSAFETFDTAEAGIRAMAVLLRGYQRRNGLNTLRGILNKYAPPVENNTSAYVGRVSSEVGIHPDAVIDLRDNELCFRVVRAMIRVENGRVIYSDAQIMAGVQAA